ncbi:MAG: hypothetical protein ACRD5G_13610 [Candidatus Acidiferrales bacterium]
MKTRTKAKRILLVSTLLPVLSLIVCASSFAQQRALAAKVNNLPGCPLQLERAMVESDIRGIRLGQLTLHSTGGVKMWAAKYRLTYEDGERDTVYVISPVGGRGLQERKTIEKLGGYHRGDRKTHRLKEAVVELFYVQSSDGAEWGKDDGGVLARAAGERLLMQAERQRLLDIYNKGGESALVQRLFQPANNQEDSRAAATRESLIRVYNAKGIEGVISTLRKVEVRGRMIKVLPGRP